MLSLLLCLLLHHLPSSNAQLFHYTTLFRYLKAKKSNYIDDVSTKKNNITEDDSNHWLKQLDETSPIDMLASWSESEPTTQQKYMVEELVEREQLPFGVINILLQFVMLKEDMKLPKTYIFEIASNWKKKCIKTGEEAYYYAKKVNQHTSKQSNQTKNCSYKHRQLVFREMTPKWLEERDSKETKNQSLEELNNPDEDEALKRDREALLKRLNSKREEE